MIARSGIASLVLVLCACGPGHEPRPNLIVVTLDTVRADHVFEHPEGRVIAPNMAGLAHRGVRFDRAVAPAPWTLPSLTSIMTGRYPSEHGVVHAEVGLAPGVPVVAEVVRAAGYHTAAIVSHWFAGSRHGLDRGFELFDERMIQGHDAVTSPGVTDLALTVVDTIPEPFLLWVHYFDPHNTYVRHPEIGFADGYDGPLPDRITAAMLGDALKEHADRPFPADDLEHIRATYDEELAFTDQHVGRFLEGLRTRGLDRRSMVVLTADHGEEFLDHGRFLHGERLYDELIKVPLIVAGDLPRSLRGRTVPQPVELRWLARTLAVRAGIHNPPFGGHDLFDIDTLARDPTPVFSEGSDAFDTTLRQRAVIWNGWKLIRRRPDGVNELYRLEEDPGERRDLWSAPDVEAQRTRLIALLERFDAIESSTPVSVDLEADERERLEALGYVE